MHELTTWPVNVMKNIADERQVTGAGGRHSNGIGWSGKASLKSRWQEANEE